MAIALWTVMRIHFAAPVAALALGLIACSGSRDGASSSHQAVTQVCGESANGPVQGVDVSVYQGNFNWSGAGAEFGYARISDGTGYIDSTFDANWANMKSAGVLRGAYQFFEPSENEVTQANMMVAKVGMLGRGDLPAMIDVEATGGQSPATIAAKIRHWLQIVEAGTGKRPFIYTGSYFWEGNVQDTTFGSYPIWIAAYGPKCPSLPPGWNNWLMWQYSDGNGTLDHDVFNGSLAELKALAGDSGGTVGLREWAFQANTSNLWTVGSAGNSDWQLGMMADTSPSITALSNGGFEAAFQANTGSLWTTGSAGTSDWQLGMMAGTSPSIAALAGGGFEVAYQANTGSLWTVGDAGNTDWKLGMMAGTSPSIAALPGGGFEVGLPGEHDQPVDRRKCRQQRLAARHDDRHESQHHRTSGWRVRGRLPGEH